jgi:hypothetical protein
MAPPAFFYGAVPIPGIPTQNPPTERGACAAFGRGLDRSGDGFRNVIATVALAHSGLLGRWRRKEPIAPIVTTRHEPLEAMFATLLAGNLLAVWPALTLRLQSVFHRRRVLGWRVLIKRFFG